LGDFTITLAKQQEIINAIILNALYAIYELLLKKY
tara:strand:+ start:414 stop:518 length:105 start_codon:yes stop_codon:yes gene_type:complete